MQDIQQPLKTILYEYFFKEKEIKDFSIGATMDWMSGNFSLHGQVIISWDRGRRKKRGPFDNWKSKGQTICDTINLWGKS